jgi:mRNA interferase RelE/StbE
VYSIFIKPSAIKELKKLPEKNQGKVFQTIHQLELYPRAIGSKKLKGSEHRWRIRIGDYRILYELNTDTKTVEIFRILHRKDVYR